MEQNGYALGKAVYGYDKRVPDMLYGAVARPPASGAWLNSAGPGDAGDRGGFRVCSGGNQGAGL